MQFLKTFFAQILRKGDVDFIQGSGRDGFTETHYDLTNARGGVINGLDVTVSSDALSITIQPGTFYNGGPLNSNYGLGGGERGFIYEVQTFTNLPDTPLIGDKQSYLVVYAKTSIQNSNPDPTKSQAIVTSKNVQTGENVAVRDYVAASIVVSNPVLPAQFNLVNGIPLAVTQVTNGAVTSIDTTYKRSYELGSVVTIASGNFNASTVDYIIGQVTDTQLINIPSQAIAVWDGTTAYNDLDGFGIANQHLKDGAVTADKINPASGLNNFSVENHVFNSSFEVVNNSSDTSPIVGWDTWVEATGLNAAGNPTTFGAVVQKTSSESYRGENSIYATGPSVGLLAGVAGKPYGFSFSQDVSFSGNKINNKPVMAYFYMKSNAMNVGISGVNGIQASVQFLAGGSELDSPIEFASYSGAAIDWTKFEITTPLSYTTDPTTTVDGIRLKISGTITSSSTVYFDNFYIGMTDIQPAWTSSQADIDYSDTLTKGTIVTDNLTANVQITASQISSPTASTSMVGSSTSRFDTSYTDNLYTNNIVINGQGVGLTSKKFQIWNVAGTYLWTVPAGIYSIEAILVGGGGGGCGGGSNGNNGNGGSSGGAGEWVKTWLPVTPGTTLQIKVGAGGTGGQHSYAGDSFYYGGFGNGGARGEAGTPSTISIAGAPTVLISAAAGSPGFPAAGGSGGGSVGWDTTNNIMHLAGLGGSTQPTNQMGANGGDTHPKAYDLIGAGGAGGVATVFGGGFNWLGGNGSNGSIPGGGGGGGSGENAGGPPGAGTGGIGGGGAIAIYY